jgi:hypothetical protein
MTEISDAVKKAASRYVAVLLESHRASGLFEVSVHEELQRAAVIKAFEERGCVVTVEEDSAVISVECPPKCFA